MMLSKAKEALPKIKHELRTEFHNQNEDILNLSLLLSDFFKIYSQ